MGKIQCASNHFIFLKINPYKFTVDSAVSPCIIKFVSKHYTNIGHFQQLLSNREPVCLKSYLTSSWTGGKPQVPLLFFSHPPHDQAKISGLLQQQAKVSLLPVDVPAFALFTSQSGKGTERKSGRDDSGGLDYPTMPLCLLFSALFHSSFSNSRHERRKRCSGSEWVDKGNVSDTFMHLNWPPAQQSCRGWGCYKVQQRVLQRR